MTASTVEIDVAGPAAPPRRNGEMVFTAPWEGRVFGLAMSLVEAGALPYEEFRERLIEQIAMWEAVNPDGVGYSYYACWLAALEQAVEGRSLVAAGEVVGRTAALAGRPAGHDHGHGHGDDHEHA